MQSECVIRLHIQKKYFILSKTFSEIERACYRERCEEFNNDVNAGYFAPPGKTR